MDFEIVNAENLIAVRGQSLDEPLTAITVRFANGAERLFYMQIPTEGVQVITNARGRWKRIDGQFVDPDTQPPDTQYETEVVDIDALEVVRQNVESYLDRTGDKPEHERVHPRKGELRAAIDAVGGTKRERALKAVKDVAGSRLRKRRRDERESPARKRGR